MRLALLLCATLALTGCLASGGGEDPFAYTEKPLYASGFDLSALGEAGVEQQFRVQDGSIASIQVFVWVNATAGGGHVELTDPSGRTVLVTEETTQRAYPLTLGQWRLHIAGQPDEAGALEGRVDILVVRG